MRDGQAGDATSGRRMRFCRGQRGRWVGGCSGSGLIGGSGGGSCGCGGLWMFLFDASRGLRGLDVLMVGSGCALGIWNGSVVVVVSATKGSDHAFDAGHGGEMRRAMLLLLEVVCWGRMGVSEEGMEQNGDGFANGN